MRAPCRIAKVIRGPGSDTGRTEVREAVLKIVVITARGVAREISLTGIGAVVVIGITEGAHGVRLTKVDVLASRRRDAHIAEGIRCQTAETIGNQNARRDGATSRATKAILVEEAASAKGTETEIRTHTIRVNKATKANPIARNEIAHLRVRQLANAEDLPPHHPDSSARMHLSPPNRTPSTKTTPSRLQQRSKSPTTTHPAS